MGSTLRNLVDVVGYARREIDYVWCGSQESGPLIEYRRGKAVIVRIKITFYLLTIPSAS